MGEVSLLIERASEGDRAASSPIFALLFPELRRIARPRLSGGEYTEIDEAMGVCSRAGSCSRDAARAWLAFVMRG
jgi:hypothetical protein